MIIMKRMTKKEFNDDLNIVSKKIKQKYSNIKWDIVESHRDSISDYLKLLNIELFGNLLVAN